MKLIWSTKTPHGLFETWVGGRGPESLSWLELQQVHGKDLVDLSKENTSFQSQPADGFISAVVPKQTLLIKTADCLPILLTGKSGLAFIHAGWRGLHQNILDNPLIESVAPTKIYVGPHIGPESYEVSEDFTENFPNSDNFIRIDGKLKWSLIDECLAQVRKLYPRIEVEVSPLCTFKTSELCSYRRDKTNQRNWNLFKPN